MTGHIRAELAKQARRPACWLLLAVAVGLTLTFAYLIPYLGYVGASDGPTSGRGLPAMLPAQFIGSSIGGTPVFVGALGLIFGVLVVGSEYGWQTWKTVLAQRHSRLRVYGAKLVVVAVGVLLGVLAMLAAAAAASTAIAVAEDQSLSWPALDDIVLGFAGASLVVLVWAMLGACLAIVLRTVALPIGLGLVWLLAVQNLISAIAAPVLDWVAELQKWLPGPNGGSLVAALGAATDTPGVSELVGGGRATVVLAAYLAGFVLLGGWLLRRRDIT